MSQTPREHFHEILADFSRGMLVTHMDDGQLRARPMEIAQIESDADLWFLTDVQSAKAHEIAEDSQVCVTLQNDRQFLSISGRASIVQDRVKIRELWKEAWKTWFPAGQEDPNLALIKVQAEKGEYWDIAGLEGLRYLFQAGKAYLQGSRPDVDKGNHQKVSL